jgi:dephospho-CoA kinase
MIVVVTGPICAGKSTYVADLVARYKASGTPVLAISLDEIGHEVIEELYGPDCDRAQLAARVFSDRALLERLEERTHPLIMAHAESLTCAFHAEHPDMPVIIESPLPLDVAAYPWLCDARFLRVDAPYEVRRDRARGRGMDLDQFEARETIQRDLDYRGIPVVGVENAESDIDKEPEMSR